MFNYNDVTFTLDNDTYNKLHELVSDYNCNRNQLLKIWIDTTYNELKHSPEWIH